MARSSTSHALRSESSRVREQEATRPAFCASSVTMRFTSSPPWGSMSARGGRGARVEQGGAGADDGRDGADAERLRARRSRGLVDGQGGERGAVAARARSRRAIDRGECGVAKHPGRVAFDRGIARTWLRSWPAAMARAAPDASATTEEVATRLAAAKPARRERRMALIVREGKGCGARRSRAERRKKHNTPDPPPRAPDPGSRSNADD